jgi:DNA-binding NarL/FixJ family response regulator
MIILIVDDSEPMRRTLKTFIRDLAEAVYECEDGGDALAAYERYRPGCVLMDIEMKRVDGIRATKEIIAAFPEARIIILTSYDDPHYRAAASAAGALAYVTKENLLELRRLLSASDADPEPGQAGS